MEFQGKIAIITGAAKGMGLGCAKKFASLGATVVVVDVDESSLSASAQSLKNTGGEVLEVVADLNDFEAVKELVNQVDKTYGKVDFLINCAGIQTYGTAEETDLALWDRTMNINVRAMFYTAKAVLPIMKRHRSGSIVNISSVQSLANQKGVVAYATSKAAANGLTRALAIDNAEFGIRVNAVLPASIDTPMLRASADMFKGDGTIDDVLNTWGKAHPIQRIGTTEEVAELVAFLASDKSSFMTGGTYNIDGGLMSQVPVVIPEN